MWKRFGVIALWVMATVGTASITLAAVSQVGGQVSERPAVPIAGADLVIPTTVAAPSTSSSTVTTVAPTTTEPVASTVTTQATSTTHATTTTATNPATTTTVASTTTAVSQSVTTSLIGGTVTVRHSGSTVTLISAVPASGFTADVESGGPNQVEVEFKSGNHESKYHASISDGRLDVETEEGDD
jgi:hypothetical protein